MSRIRIEIEVPEECAKNINNFEDLRKVLRAWLDKEDEKCKAAEVKSNDNNSRY